MKAILEAKEFKRIIDNTKRFASEFNGIHLMDWIHLVIDAEKKMIRAEAIDGYRISVEYARLQDADMSFSCFIRSNIPIITKNDSYAELSLQENKLYVTVSDNIMGYIQPQGEFYKVDDYIEKYSRKSDKRFAINAKMLAEAMESIKAIDGEKIAIIDVYDRCEPIVIRSGRDGENIKLILPIKTREME